MSAQDRIREIGGQSLVVNQEEGRGRAAGGADVQAPTRIIWRNLLGETEGEILLNRDLSG